jgi:hypothetical protein
MTLTVNQLIGFGARRASASGPPSSFTADLTSTSLAIYGAQDGSYPATNAFDNNTATGWINNAGTYSTSNCWVGQDFGSGIAKVIRKITLRNSTHGGMSAGFWWNTLKLRYSDDGSTWSDAIVYGTGSATLTKTDDSTTTDEYVFENHGAHRYWSVLGLTGVTPAGYGGIGEIEMMEAA